MSGTPPTDDRTATGASGDILARGIVAARNRAECERVEEERAADGSFLMWLDRMAVTPVMTKQG